MKFLVDNALSPYISDQLNKLGHDAIHVRDIGLKDASDKTIFDEAEKQERTIISSDTDFGLLLSKRRSLKPSIILFRKGTERNPKIQVKLLKNNLHEKVKKAIQEGCVIIIEPNRIRIKPLPIF